MPSFSTQDEVITQVLLLSSSKFRKDFAAKPGSVPHTRAKAQLAHAKSVFDNAHPTVREYDVPAWAKALIAD